MDLAFTAFYSKRGELFKIVQFDSFEMIVADFDNCDMSTTYIEVFDNCSEWKVCTWGQSENSLSDEARYTLLEKYGIIS